MARAPENDEPADEPERQEQASGEEDVEAAGGLPAPWSTPDEDGEEGEAEPAPAERVGALMRHPAVWAGLAVLVLVVAGLATWPMWKDALPGGVLAALTGEPEGAARGRVDLPQRPPEARPPEPRPPAPPPVTREDVAALSERLAARLDKLESAVGDLRSAVDPAATAALAERVDGLDARLGRLDASLAKRIESIDSRLIRLDAEAARRADGEALTAAVAAMTQRVSALESALTELLREGRTGRADALVLAVGHLREAASRGGPFAAELAGLQEVADGNRAVGESVAALRPHAEAGAPTLEALRADFDGVARAAVRAAVAPPAGGWVDRTIARITSVVTIRPVGGDAVGDSAGAVVARAEARLKVGDLAGAVAALDGLAGAPADAVAEWRRKARARIDVDRALAELTRIAIPRLAEADEGRNGRSGRGDR